MSTDKRQPSAPMRVATLVSSISRRAGGLFHSVRHLNHAVREWGVDTSVFSLRDRFTDEDRHTWNGVRMTVCDVRGPAGFGFSPDLKREVFLTSAELLHRHGIWMYPSYVVLQWSKFNRKPVVISPHGMLDSWALKNSAWKKKIAGWLYENRNLRSAACIHALCESEYQSIRAYGLTNPVAIIPNGVDLPDLQAGQNPPPWNSQIGADKNVMLFLGRIHPKKGLENLIRAWGILKGKKLKELEQWHLVIAGWSQGGHEEKLKRLANELNLEADVTFTGPLYDTAKDAALRTAKAFILPSFSEGLPMAVLEAWAYSLPVIMTKECNIPEGFEADAALDIRPEVESIQQGLESFLSLSQTEQESMGRNGLGLVKDTFTWPKIAAQMVDVYKWVLGQSRKPDCVRLD